MSIWATITDKDHGYKRLRLNMSTGADSYTLVGFPEKGTAGLPTQSGSRHEEYDWDTVIGIASVHEFGTLDGNVPARPFLRPAIDGGHDEIAKVKQRALELMIDGKLTSKQALAVVGEYAQGRIQRAIDRVTSPALKPATIKRKGSSKPLIDTGQMRNSVQHVEVMSGEGV